MRHTTRTRWRAVSILLVLGLIAVACGGDDDSADETTATTAAAQATNSGASSDAGATATTYASATTTAAASEERAAEDRAGNAIQPGDVADAEQYEPLPEDAPDEVYAQDHGTNPFVATADDVFSTFALDVDTGSYTLARRYIESGQLPYGELIRVEEVVNFFDQGYSAPVDGTFAVYADGAPTPFTTSSRNHMIRVGIKAEDVAEVDRPTAALTFVIDVSGSMREGNRLEVVKGALMTLVDQLRPSDSVAIVAYDTEAWIVLDHTRVSDDDTILRAIARLEPGGRTNAEEGLTLGYDLAVQAFEPGNINRVILASDGVANVGTTSAGGILSRIEEQASLGINLTAVGVGLGNYNDALLEQLADRGDGFYAYVDTLDEAERLFVDGLTGTLLTVAEEAKVQVEFNPRTVESYRLLGFENRAIADEDFRDDSVDAGEIGAGHEVTALYEVTLTRPLSELGGADLATVNLRWRDPGSTVFTEFNGLLPSSVLESSFALAEPRFQLGVVAAAYAEILRESPWAGEITLGWVADEAFRLAETLDDQEVWEFAQLTADAALLAGEPVTVLGQP